MKTFSILLFLFFAFIFSDLSAQTDTVITRIITFDNVDGDTPPNSNIKYYRSVFKINPFLYLNGDIPIYYERVFTTKLSGEIGIGITRKDYIYGLLGDDSFENVIFFSGDDPKILTGSSFKLAFRYYPQAYAPEDFYMSLEFGYRQHKYEYDIPNNKFGELSRELSELKAIIGWQYESYWWNGIFWDYYIGLGARFIAEDRVQEINNNFVNPSDPKTFRVEPTNITRLGLYMGLKMGVAF